MMDEQNNPNEQPAPTVQEIKKPKTNSTSNGKICLVISIIIATLATSLHIIGDILPHPYDNAMVKIFYIPYYCSLFLFFIFLLICTIVCIIMLISTLVKKNYSQVTLSAIGVALCLLTILGYSIFPPLVVQKKTYPEHENAEIQVNENLKCTSSMEREKRYKETADPYDDLDSSSATHIAEDIACAYVEYIYHNYKEPESIEDLSSYFKLPETKNGTVLILINNDDIPHEENIYNITTHKTCNNNSDGAISVWYYSRIGSFLDVSRYYRVCDSFSAGYEDANIYDTNSDNYVQLSY